MKGTEREKIAEASEILEFLTQVLRGGYDTENPEKSAQLRMKAAELLGRRCGAFAEGSVQELPVIVDDIGDAHGDP